MLLARKSSFRHDYLGRYLKTRNYLKTHPREMHGGEDNEGNACVARIRLLGSSPSTISARWRIPSDGVVNPVKSHRSVHDGDSQDERWNARARLQDQFDLEGGYSL